MRPSSRRGSKVHLIASLGGHLELLEVLSPAFKDLRRTWITSEGAKAEALRVAGERVLTLPRLDRGSAGASTVLTGVRLALHERPDLVVSTGAGLAVPFTLTSRALGARVLFAETMARVTSPSASGRILSRVASGFFVQWPELAPHYARAVVCRPALLEQLPDLTTGGGTGTFVTVGSHDSGFGRLFEVIAKADQAGLLPHPIFVQQGVSTDLPGGLAGRPFLTPDEFRARVRAAEVVISHGGAGALATIVRAGKRPLVMTRRSSLGEHVDNHQEEIVAKLESVGLLIRIEDSITAAHLGCQALIRPRPAFTGESLLNAVCGLIEP